MSRSYEAEVIFVDLAEASFSNPFDRVDFLVQIIIISVRTRLARNRHVVSTKV